MQPIATPSQYRAAARSLAFVLLLGIVAIGFLSFAAFGQDVHPVLPSVLPASESTATTVWGWVFRALVALAFILGGLLAWKIHQVLDAHKDQTDLVGLLSRIGSKAMAAGGQALNELRPMIDDDLADGKIDQAEMKALLDKAGELLKKIAYDELSDLGPILGLADQTAIGHYVEGVAGNALRQLIKTITGGRVEIPALPSGTAAELAAKAVAAAAPPPAIAPVAVAVKKGP